MLSKDVIDGYFLRSIPLGLAEDLNLGIAKIHKNSVFTFDHRGELVKSCPRISIKLSEDLTKADKDQVSKMIDKAIKEFSKKDESDDTRMIKNALISLFKTFYVKRNFWSSEISTSRST